MISQKLKEYKHNYYQTHKQMFADSKKKFINELKDSLGGKCAHCGSTTNLQFHHTDPSKKKFTIGKPTNYTRAEIKKEAKKCILLCRDCHIKEHQRLGHKSTISLEQEVIRSGNYRIQSDGKIFSFLSNRYVGYSNKAGYRFLQFIRKNGKIAKVKIHRLVYAVHGPDKLSSKLVINHIDGNPSNNDISNLEQVTQAANNLHKYRVLGYPPVYGNAKLTKEKADKIRELYKAGAKGVDLAKQFNVCKSVISEIVHNKIWV